jgi:hypothetical protein
MTYSKRLNTIPHRLFIYESIGVILVLTITNNPPAGSSMWCSCHKHNDKREYQFRFRVGTLAIEAVSPLCEKKRPGTQLLSLYFLTEIYSEKVVVRSSLDGKGIYTGCLNSTYMDSAPPTYHQTASWSSLIHPARKTSPKIQHSKL